MFKTLALAIAALMTPLSLAAATPVYKCSANGSVMYQSDPCSSGEAKKPPTVEQLNVERQKTQRQPGNGSAIQSAPGTGGQGSPNLSTDSVSPASGKTERPASTVTPLEPRAGSFKCDGRKYCSQMTSCAEARYFLAHCPGVKMDGDGNGVPCERQWCNK